MEGHDIFIAGLSNDGLEGSGGRGEDGSDFLGRHIGNGRGTRCTDPVLAGLTADEWCAHGGQIGGGAGVSRSSRYDEEHHGGGKSYLLD